MLELYPGYRTDNVEIIRDTTLTKFGGTFFDLSGRSSPLAVKANWAGGAELMVINARCSEGAEVEYEVQTFLRQYFLVATAKGLEFDLEGNDLGLSSTCPSVIVPAQTPVRIKASGKHEILSLRIETEAVKRMVGALFNDDGMACPTFSNQLRLEDLGYQHIRRTVSDFITDLELLGPEHASTILEMLGQSLILKFLYYNHHSLSSQLRHKEAGPSITQVKLIESYLEANWERPLDIEGLVKVFDISARSIFRHFKKTRGISPAEFLNGIRLKEAHRLLQAAIPDNTITAVALKCGFSSIGHFSRKYRTAFGELPSETLRRAR